MNISIFAPDFREKMRGIFVLFFGLFLLNFASAQIHEVGIFIGGSNFIGDVGKEKHISPDSPAFGGIYKWNKSTRHSWRFSIMHSSLKIDDALADSESRQERGYALKNKVTEISAGLEFNFFEFNLHNLGFKITPYVHTGVSYFWYDNKYIVSGIAENDGGKSGGLSIPMTLGVKFNVANNWIVGIETGVRYTFVDDIDGSNPKKASRQQYRFGNLNSNDWYVFTGFTITYTFGRNPCYCPQ